MLWCHFTSTMSVLYAATTFVHEALLIEADEHMTRLYHQLLIDYNKEIRPVIRQNMPVNTSIAFSLVQVVDVDERNQLLTSLAWIHFRWNDWRLAWDPQLNGQLTKLNSIWIPDIILYNNAAQEYLKEMTTASVTYDGNISLSMAGIFKSSCALDVRFYPFDFQNCLMKFASWAYDGTKIDIWSDSKGDQSNYMVSTEWTLREVLAKKNSIIYSCCPEPYPFIDVHLLLERKPLFFVIFLCLPCVLISLLVLLGFYMPSDSGEKVTLGITSLLSTTVFLMLVSEHLPPTADALPLIGIYYGVTIFIVSLQTAFTVFTLNIHHIGTHGSPVPPLLQYLLFGRFAGFLLLSIEPRYHSINEHVQYFFLKQSAEEKERRRQSQESDEPPVWELASAVSAAGKNVRQSPPTANGNNKATTAADGSGRVSRKRVSFPELPPESPPLLYQQNGGTSTGVRNNRRRVLSLVSGTSPSRRLASAKMLLQQLPPLPTVAASPLPPPSPTGTEHHNSCCSSLASSSASPLLNTEAAVVEEETEELNFEAEFIRVLSRLKEVIERNELRLVEKDRRNAEKLEWQQVALVLDRFLLVLFSICTVAVLFSTVFQCSKRSSLW